MTRTIRFRPVRLGASLLLSFLLLGSLTASAQNFIPGKIVRPATNAATRLILDPNGDGFTSATTNGYYGQDDVASDNNELQYKPLYPFYAEPNADLRRGPNSRFTDYVPSTIDKASYYMYYSGTNLHLRVRMGSIIPGAKGYSFLVDIDGKFGATGPLADPNFLAQTSGVNGNPGFEIEIDLFSQASQTGVAVYNVDGKDKRNDFLPAVWSVNNWLEYSQVAMAATSDNGDPDYYIDFYVPFSVLSGINFAAPTTPTNISTSTPIRIIPTTVMAPLPAIGGPKSDLYGLPDNLYPSANDEYIAMLGSMPAYTIGNFATGGSGQSAAACTAPPILNKVSSASSTATVTGTWTPNNTTGAILSNVVITLYRSTGGAFSAVPGGTATITATSSSNTVSWSIPNVPVAAGNTYYAVAQAPGETACFQSATVTASNCAIPMAAPVLDASCVLAAGNVSSKGFTFNNKPSVWPNSFAKVSNTSLGTSATQTSTAGTGITGTSNIQNGNGSAAQFFREGSATGVTPANPAAWDFSSGCSGGPGLSAGSYRFWVEDANGCASGILIGCVTGTGNTASQLGGGAAATSLNVPAITSPANGVLTSSTTSITVSATQGSTVTFLLNGVSQGTAIAANGAATALAIGTSGTVTFPIAAGTLSRNDRVQFLSEYKGASISTSYCGRSGSEIIVSCVTQAPSISTNSTTGLLQPSSPGGFIQGTASSIGGTVTIYNSTATGTSLGTATVGSTGAWTSAVTPVSGQSYVATVTGTNGCASTYSPALLYSNATTSASLCTGAAITSYTTTYSNGTAHAAPGTTVNNGPPTSSAFAMNAFATTVTASFATSSNPRLISLYEDGNFIASTRVAANATTAVFSNGVASGDNLGFYTGTTGTTSPGNVYFTISDTSTTLQTYLPETTCPNVGVVTCPVTTQQPTLTVANCPTCTTVGTSSATVPAGGTVTFKLSNVSPNTIYAIRSTTGVSYSNTYTVPANFTGTDIYLSTFSISGTAGSTVTLEAIGTTVIVSNGVTVSCASTSTTAAVTLQAAAGISISGTVYDDPYKYNVGGTPVSSVTNALNASRQLYVYLLNSSNAIQAVATVSSASTNTGTYTFSSLVSGTTYKVVIDTVAGRGLGSLLSTASVPFGWAHKAEGIGNAAGDGTPDGIYTANTITASQVVNFGINGIPSATTTSAASQVNPGGTTSTTVPAGTFGGSDARDVGNTGIVEYVRITGFPTNATSITITGTQNINNATSTITYYASTLPVGCTNCALFPAGGVYVPASTNGNLSNASAVQVDPVNGAVTVAIPYVTVDNGGRESAAASASQPLSEFSVSGTVYHDGDALTDNSIDGTATGQVTNNGSNLPLYVNLVNAGTGNVVAVAAVNTSTGAYSFGTADGLTVNSSYTVVLSTTQGTVGAAAPTAVLPTTLPGWIFTGEGVTAAGDGSANGSFSTGTLSASAVVNFGVNARPTAGTNTVAAGVNPGGTNSYAVPGGSFNPADVSPGSIASVTITSFPTNTTSFTAGGVTYTSSSFAAAGGSVTVPFSSGNPSATFSLDPANGAVSPVISYTTTDNGGATGNNTGTLTLNFSTLALSGTVYHDGNALTDNTVNGTGSNLGGTLFVNAVSGGAVAGSATVASDGTWSIAGLSSGTYSVILTNSNSNVSAALASGYVFTGEGSTAAGDGSPNGTFGTGSISGSITGLNFGFNALPTAGTNTVSAGNNPGGTNTYTLANGSFNPTDVAPGTIASITITSFPTNATSFTAGGVTYTAASFAAAGGSVTVPFTSGNPSQPVQIDPVAGAVSPVFSYTTTDNGGSTSANTGSLTLNFTDITISGTVYNDYNGGSIGGNGAGTLGGTPLYVNLVNTASGNVTASKALPAGGTYSFTSDDGVQGGSSYNLVLSTSATGTSGLLPAGYVFTAEGSTAAGDGTANGLFALGSVSSSQAVSFGVNALPVADLKAYSLNPNTSSAIASVTVTSSANAANSYAAEIALSGTASSGDTPGALTGTDADGNNGSSLTLGASVSGVSLVIDPASYAGTRNGSAYADALMLRYNGIQLQPGGCQGADATSGNPACGLFNGATGKWEIPAYDLSALTVLAKNGSSTLGFSYAWKDAAGFTGNTNTYSISFSQVLPLRLGAFTASARSESTAELQWNTFDEVNTQHFAVEHSTDGRTFRAVGTVGAQGQAAAASYSFLHTGLAAGTHYYRLRMVDRDATFTYSPVRLVTLDGAAKAGFTLAPNPAQAGATRILWMGPTARPVQVRVLDAAGRPVWSGSMSSSVLLLPTGGWAAGIYQVQLFQDGRSYHQQLLVP
ncbi:hypothetical protein [Flaviaesturariibacter amylovorans]